MKTITNSPFTINW